MIKRKMSDVRNYYPFEFALLWISNPFFFSLEIFQFSKETFKFDHLNRPFVN